MLLTAGVVHANRWAQDLPEQSGVHVVSGLQDVLRVLDRFDDMGDAVGNQYTAAVKISVVDLATA